MRFSSKKRNRLKSYQNPYAVVIGMDNVQGLQTARLLKKHNIPVIAIVKNPKHYACFTNSCKTILSANTQSEEFLELLESLGPQFASKPVLFPCEDTSVLLLSKFRSRIDFWYEIVLPEHQIVETLLDKGKFHSYAQKHQLPVPKTYFIQNAGEAKRACDQLTFPAILKPAIKNKRWNETTNLKAFRLANKDDFWTVYKNYSSLSQVFIAQQWIHGDDKNNFTCNCYFDKNSNPVITFMTQKVRQWPPNTGQACMGVEKRNDKVLSLAINIFKQIHYYGLAYLEVKRNEQDGQYYMIEANIGRPTGRSATAEASGVDLLYTMYCDAIGRLLPQNREQKYKGTKWIHLRRDLQSTIYHLRTGDLTIWEWLKSHKGPKTYALFSLRDPLPFLGDLLRALFLVLIPEERKKRNYKEPARLHTEALQGN